ncbi:MAG: RNA polymerase sigma factor [Planctomycetota bacterium]
MVSSSCLTANPRPFPAASGDAIAFDRLHEKYLPIVTAYLLSLDRCCTSLEDLVQEVFARLWQNRNLFSGASTVNHYLYGIVRNVLSEERKRLSRQVSAEHSRLQKQPSDRPVGLSEPDLGVSRAEIEEAVEIAIARLTPKDRHAVRLFYFERLTSLGTMATRANCSTEAFRSRLRRARGRLRRLLSDLET